MKISGKNEFVLHDAKFSSITHIRNCLELNDQVFDSKRKKEGNNE